MLIDTLLEKLETAWRFVRVKLSGVNALDRQDNDVSGEQVSNFRNALVNCPVRPIGKPKVSIIILTLETAGLLERLFQSFLEHNTWDNFEIIVVNHGVDPESQNCLERWSDRLPIREIRLLKNYSFAYSCNRAAEIATGDVLILLNNDIEFDQDVVPRICAGVQKNRGLAGIKLYHHGGGDGLRGAHHHIGVRFRWDIKQCWLSPYNVMPKLGDETYEQKPTRLPAVTAAMVGCDRAEFLELGGFHEGYVYAYEDVDLCLKYRLGLNAQIISYNDVLALHGEGETRTKRASLERRRVWRSYNSTIFRNRFGCLIRRDFYQGLFGDGQVSWGRQPVVAVVDDGSGIFRNLKTRMVPHFSWGVCEKSPNIAGYDLYGMDLLICANWTFSLKRSRHRSPSMISIGLIASEVGAWSPERCDEFDVLAATTHELAKQLQLEVGRPVCVLTFDDDVIADQISTLVRNFTGERNKVSIKVPSADVAPYIDLKAALQKRGDKVRIDKPKDWSCRQRVRDDVVLWCAPPTDGVVQEGSVNIALFDIQPSEVAGKYDAVLNHWGAWDKSYIKLLDAIDENVKRRLQVPLDQPLMDRSNMADADRGAIWFERSDPVRALLDM